MRINHNLASLNTYRQLSANSANAQKSIEKLSSGLRINRAGDDAAGLAISEKMRSQIRGLDQAARNSQDAISLIQTAEGALGETHSILQRMRELATQAANDTNTTADRGEIQKEINQLTSEINNIGNSTQFNTRKLLNGEIKVGTGSALGAGANAPSYKGSSLFNVAVSASSSAAAGTYKAEIVNLGGQTSRDVGAVQTIGSAANATITGTNLDNSMTAGSYKVVVASENAVNTTVNTKQTGIAKDSDITVAADSTLADSQYKIAIEKTTTHNVTSISTAGLSDLKLAPNADTPADASYKISTSATVATADAGGSLSTVVKNVSIASNSTFAEKGANGAQITISQTAAGTAEYTIQIINDVGFGNENYGSVKFTVNAADGVKQLQIGDFSLDVDFAALYSSDSGTGSTVDTDDMDITIGRKVTITNLADATKTGSLDVSGGASDGTVTLANSGGKFTLDAKNANQVAPGQDLFVTVTTTTKYDVQLLKASDDSSVNGSAKVTLTANDMTTPSSYKNVNLGNGVSVDLDAAALIAAATGTKNTTFTTNTAASKTAVLQDAAGTDLTAKYTLGAGANATQALGAYGATFKYNTGGGAVAAGSYVFTVDSNTTANDFRLSLTRTLDGDGKNDGTVLINQQTVDPNATVQLGNGVSVKTAVNMLASDNVIYHVASGTVDSSLTMQVGSNMGQVFSVDVSDMRADALGISSNSNSTAIVDENGSTVADAAWTSAKVATNDVNSQATEYVLDVSDAEKASAAIKVIDVAIATVSSERSKLGAFQNRLEHTINNLGTTSENLTASESRIRDVDMAKEMVEFTKNNILSQAAQSMLAQANQQPQGVLQLLRA